MFCCSHKMMQQDLATVAGGWKVPVTSLYCDFNFHKLHYTLLKIIVIKEFADGTRQSKSLSVMFLCTFLSPSTGCQIDFCVGIVCLHFCWGWILLYCYTRCEWSLEQLETFLNAISSPVWQKSRIVEMLNQQRPECHWLVGPTLFQTDEGLDGQLFLRLTQHLAKPQLQRSAMTRRLTSTSMCYWLRDHNHFCCQLSSV